MIDFSDLKIGDNVKVIQSFGDFQEDIIDLGYVKNIDKDFIFVLSLSDLNSVQDSLQTLATRHAVLLTQTDIEASCENKIIKYDFKTGKEISNEFSNKCIKLIENPDYFKVSQKIKKLVDISQSLKTSTSNELKILNEKLDILLLDMES